jgi:lipid II:glycine glycyltransferase (peptidoglycan interpeptide bridge formation enzyme)
MKEIFNFIKVCEVYYEPEYRVVNALLVNHHHFARIYSYNDLCLPKEYVVKRIKKTTRIILGDKSKDDILASFKKNYRNEIRRTLNDSRFVFTIQEGFLEEGYELYREFETKSGRAVLSREESEGVWALGYIGNELVSGVFLINAMPVLKVISIFSVRKEKGGEQSTEVAWVSKRLVLEICHFAKDRDFAYVDLAYINTEDDSKAGITKYKLGFGGDVINEYLYEKDTQIIVLLRWLRRKINL